MRKKTEMGRNQEEAREGKRKSKERRGKRRKQDKTTKDREIKKEESTNKKGVRVKRSPLFLSEKRKENADSEKNGRERGKPEHRAERQLMETNKRIKERRNRRNKYGKERRRR